MKINFFADGIYKSGGMKIIFEYANRLTLKGHDVILYYPLFPYNYFPGSINLKSFFKNLIHRLRYFTKHRKYIFRDYRNLFRIKCILNLGIFVRNADVLIATRWPTAYFVHKLNVNKGKKFYFIQGYELWDSDKDSVDNSYTLDLRRITISSFMRDFLKEKFSVDSDVVLNGIDFSQFYNNKKIFKNKNILFIDREQGIKGIMDLVKVIENVHSVFPDVNFTGFAFKKSNVYPSYVNIVENPGLEKIRELYSNADIFLFTSLSEGFGLPPAEAMACKCAVVSTNVGAIRDFAVNNHSVLLSEPGDIMGLTKNVITLLKDTNKLMEISLNGFEEVKKNLSWEKSVSQMEMLLMK